MPFAKEPKLAPVLIPRFPKGDRRVWDSLHDDEWEDWHWQFMNQIHGIEGLEGVIAIGPDEISASKRTQHLFKIGITPYYASLMDPEDPNCPIRRQALPSVDELYEDPSDMEDPLGEESNMPVKGITHRYPDRVLFYITQNCAMYCRHCTRKRKVADPATAANSAQIQNGIEYIRAHPEVRDVIVSGGDPLTFEDDRLEGILAQIRDIEHVEIIRIGTRVPVTMPMRITDELVTMLQRYQPIYVNTHFNHPKECTNEALRACTALADGGFPIGNQMVLLKGVNDDVDVVRELNAKLLMMRVKPYYIYQCDPTRGNYHFRTTVSKGLEIIAGLRGWMSGLAVPHYVIDAPGGGGKIPLIPEKYLQSHVGNKITLRNFRDKEYVYYEPVEDPKR